VDGEVPPPGGAALIGGTGIVTAATFLWLSAPDLALTQLMVETVTTVLILLGLRWLPPRIEATDEPEQPGDGSVWLRRARDLAVAVAGGGALAALTYAVLVHPASDTIADFFLLNALERRWRQQRGERAAGGFPQLRHPGRDHRARGRRAHRVCAAAPLPPGARERRHPAAAAPRRRPGERPDPGRAGRQRLPAGGRASTCACCCPSWG
jgi:hypothetical protein